ncbi:MAG: T9SS type A sorting domain-containing protein, partial [Bacteroidota bacterium]
GRTLLPGTTVLKILNYDYSLFSPATHYWNIDASLSLNSANNDLVFENITPVDTTNLNFGGTSFELNSGDQNYRNIYMNGLGLIMDGTDSFPVVATLMVSMNGTALHIFRAEHCSYAYLNLGDITIDSIISYPSWEIGIPQLGVSVSDTSSINYIEGGTLNISTGIYNYFEKVVASGDLTIDSWFLPTPIFNVNTFGDVFAGRNFTETNATLQGLNANRFRKCVIMGDGIFHSDTCIFDTLMFNQGHDYKIDPGKIVMTNNQFIAFGSTGNPIQLHSATIGTQANMVFNQNDVCSDYLFLRDINASGTNVIAGANSQNIANNTGWQFIPCSVSSNVWPGDANYDLIVNNFDLLNIGLAFGETGTARAGASNNYIAQPATDWSSFFVSAVNKKHADCDGNGMIDANDTLAVSLNYGLTHPARFAQNEVKSNSGIELSFQFPTGSIVPGSVVNILIMLGTSSAAADSIYGIAFTVNYDPSFIDQGSIYADYSGSWIGNTGYSIHLEKDFYAAGKFDVAFTRTDKNNVSGFGMIGTLTFTVANNASGMMNLSFNNIMAITNTGNEIPILAGNGSLATGIENISSMELFSLLYPNPFHDIGTIVFSNPEHKMIELRISDIAGKEILPAKITQENKITIDGKKFSKGMYLYELKTGEEKIFSRGKFVVN